MSEQVKKKPGPKPREGGAAERRSVAMSDAQWAKLELLAQAWGVRSASAVVCLLIDAAPITPPIITKP